MCTMAKQNDSSESNEPIDFNQFMFGRPPSERQSTTHKEDDDDKDNDSFDLFDTTSTLVETYRQLSPYFEQITQLIKKMK